MTKILNSFGKMIWHFALFIDRFLFHLCVMHSNFILNKIYEFLILPLQNFTRAFDSHTFKSKRLGEHSFKIRVIVRVIFVCNKIEKFKNNEKETRNIKNGWRWWCKHEQSKNLLKRRYDKNNSDDVVGDGAD